MKKVTLIASASMGLESIVADEIKSLGFKDVQTHNGRVEFDALISDIPRLNIWLRCADRLFVKMGEFKATTFEDLFQNVKKINWADFIPVDGEFPVSWVSAVKCKLFSKSDIQAISKKAMVEAMKRKHDITHFSESRGLYRVKIQGNKDNFIIMIDTSGNGLHKRGYRADLNEAPMKETMAAALVKLSKWTGGDRPLFDPMCGTGTIAIEGAMIARNIAPGSNRKFASESWEVIPESAWLDARDDAYSYEDHDKTVKIYGSDMNADTIEIAKKNAALAGVEDDIQFETRHLLECEAPAEYGCLITNPPYGERLLDNDEVERLYTTLGDICRMRLPKWSYYIITSYEEFEVYFDKKATKNRKLYNGGLKCYFYQYFGMRPPREIN